MLYPVHSTGLVQLGKLSHPLRAVVLHKARAHTKPRHSHYESHTEVLNSNGAEQGGE